MIASLGINMCEIVIKLDSVTRAFAYSCTFPKSDHTLYRGIKLFYGVYWSTDITHDKARDL